MPASSRTEEGRIVFPFAAVRVDFTLHAACCGGESDRWS
jgi:hypothetical protein